MARKRNNGPSGNQPERWPGDEDDELLRPRDVAEDADEHADEHDTANFGTERDEESADAAVEAGAADDEAVDEADDEAEAATPPSASDLASRGFTPDEVQRLVVVSDRQAHSDESQLAEAMLRRLRFTRWLIEHGMLDEWSA